MTQRDSVVCQGQHYAHGDKLPLGKAGGQGRRDGAGSHVREGRPGEWGESLGHWFESSGEGWREAEGG